MNQKQLVKQLEAWEARGRAVVGMLRDILRIGQAEVGLPYLWVGTAEIAAATTVAIPFNQPADGIIRSFTTHLEKAENQDGIPPDAYVDYVSIAARETYRNQGGFSVPTQVFGATTAEQDGMPYLHDGFLRRFAVSQQSVWNVAVVNNGADKIHLVLKVEQYSVPAGVAKRLGEGFPA